MDSAETKNRLLNTAQNLAKVRGFPLLIFDVDPILPSTVFELQRELQGNSFPEMDVLIHTPGGHVESAFNAIKVFKTVSEKLNIIVPYQAKSAGTLICLGAHKIVMTPLSELGPLDTQIREAPEGGTEIYKSALNGFKALEQVQKHAFENLDLAAKMIIGRSGMRMVDAVRMAIYFSGETSGCLYNQLNPMTIGEYARALEVGERYGVTTLTRYMGWPQERAEVAVRRLVYNYPSHGFIIDSEELRSMGFIVETPQGEIETLIQTIRALLFVKDISQEGESILKLVDPHNTVVFPLAKEKSGEKEQPGKAAPKVAVNEGENEKQ